MSLIGIAIAVSQAELDEAAEACWQEALLRHGGVAQPAVLALRPLFIKAFGAGASWVAWRITQDQASAMDALSLAASGTGGEG